MTDSKLQRSLVIFDNVLTVLPQYGVSSRNNVLTQQNEKRRVYDGMDIVQERDQNNVVTASLTRAGNIGGILARTTSAGSVFYGYDGSGNVTTLTNSAGAEVGSYTYDAWGKTIATSGTAASENPYQFSTKESIGGLYSYGFRFYSPGLGRWINRDPMGENGGTNLYGFIGNNPVNDWDEYGENPAFALPALGGVAEVGAGITAPAWGPPAAGGAFIAGLAYGAYCYIGEPLANRLYPLGQEVNGSPATINLPRFDATDKNDSPAIRYIRQKAHASKKSFDIIIEDLRKKGEFTKEAGEFTRREIDYAEKILKLRNVNKRTGGKKTGK